MYRNYSDILSRVADPVLWFDEAGVPRFGPFAPGPVANIHASEAALACIECQTCGRPFDVAFSGPAASRPLPDNPDAGRTCPVVRDHIDAGRQHYGDPPNIGCCDAGPSMNSVPRRVLEYKVRPMAPGEGAGCAWPRGGVKGQPGRFLPAGNANFGVPETFRFRREPEPEGRDLTPDWAR